MPVVKRIISVFGQKALAYYDREPVRVHTYVAGLVVAAGTAVGLVLSAPVVIAAVAFAAPVLIAEVRKEVASPETQKELLAAQPDEPHAHDPLPLEADEPEV